MKFIALVPLSHPSRDSTARGNRDHPLPTSSDGLLWLELVTLPLESLIFHL